MTTAAGGFDKLLGELEVLSKAIPADGADADADADAKVAAAAADGADAGADADADPDKKDGEELGKSFEITLADGSKVEAQDGTELIKALNTRIDATEGQMLKALESAVGLLKSQGALIKSLQDQVAKLGNEGRGRKTIVSIVDKPDAAAAALAKSEDKGVTPEAFMAKALTALKDGKISGSDLSLAEACVNRGTQIPANIISSVLG